MEVAVNRTVTGNGKGDGNGDGTAQGTEEFQASDPFALALVGASSYHARP